MLKILTVIGARPQFIKASALSREFKKYDQIDELLVHTGQHYHDNLSKIFFSELGLEDPKYHLHVGSSSHAHQTSQMLSRIEDVLLNEKPNCVLVYGDTNSTLAGALAAVKLHIPIVHVEAGLRSYNHHQAEEVNRILTDRISDLLLVPSQDAADNLIKESIPSNKISVVGDIMFDVVKIFENKAESSDILKKLQLTKGKYIVATIHRAENTDNNNINEIFNGFNKLSSIYNIVIPLHPRTHQSIIRNSIKINPAIRLIEPLGFLDMMNLVKSSAVVITDSGGLQKEAFYHKIPCITLREVTEWVELTQSGWNILLSPNQISHLADLVEDMQKINLVWDNPYGDGTTAEKIVVEILNKFSQSKCQPLLA